MPLFKNEHQAYVRRTRVYVDSDQRLTGSLSEFDFVVPLEQPLENVVGIEMVGYNIKTDLQQTFIAQIGNYNGNNILDVSVNDYPTMSNPLTYSVTIPPRNYTTVESLADDLETLLNAAVLATGNVYWIARTWSLFVQTLEGSETITIIFEMTGAFIEDIATFTFRTGPNHQNSGGGQLGFLTDEDTLGVITDASMVYVAGLPIQVQTPQLQPFRYLNVNIANAPELQPANRIILSDGTFHSSKTTVIDSRPRLLTQPIKRLDTLHVVCTMGPVFHGDSLETRPPLSRSRGGIDLIFDVLVVAQEQGIPSWVKQELTY